MLDLNSFSGFNSTKCQIGGGISTPQPCDPRIVSACTVHLTHPSHRSLTAFSLSGNAFRPIGTYSTSVSRDPLIPPSVRMKSL